MVDTTSSITVKSTKAELFAAYGDMRAKYDALQRQGVAPGQQATQRKLEDAVVKKTEIVTPASVEESVIVLRKRLQDHLEDILGQLNTETRTLSELREAITIATKRLEEIHQVQLAADTLQILFSDYDLKEKELTEKYKTMENALQEEMIWKRKDWEREQEEYQYNLKIERRKEQDAHELELAKKRLAWEEEVNQREAQLVEREEILRKQEEETNLIKQELTLLSAQKEQAVVVAKQEVEEMLRKEFAAEKQLSEQVANSESELLGVKVRNLEDIIKNQMTEIKSLKESLAMANQQAQTLAAKVIEGMSTMKQIRAVEPLKEVAKE